jgi:hypothetical protein
MKAITGLLCICAMAGAGLHAEAVTLTFDDIPVGANLNTAYVPYGVAFSSNFQVADHSTSAWGPPHSGNNVLVNQSPLPLLAGAEANFQHQGRSIYSLAGYFSTQQGAVIQLAGSYDDLYNPVATVLVGAPGESWTNRYVELRADTPMRGVHFWNVSSDQALFQYSADDITIEFTPEPSSLAALSLALAGIGIGAVRRRR